MSSPTCRHNHTTGQRVMPAHHDDDCDDTQCRGCQPCTDHHCRMGCGTHHATICPACIGAVRNDLTTIQHLCGDLLAEAMLGQQATAPAPGGTAVILLGPWSYGLTWDDDPATWVRDIWRDSDFHPLHTLETWATAWREWYDHTETKPATITRATGHLRGLLTTAAAAGPRLDGNRIEHPPDFGEMAADLHACRTRLENVLHDGERTMTGAPCIRCTRLLIRQVDHRGALTDDWECSRCKRTYTPQQYTNAVAAGYAVLAAEEAERKRAEAESA